MIHSLLFLSCLISPWGMGYLESPTSDPAPSGLHFSFLGQAGETQLNFWGVLLSLSSPPYQVVLSGEKSLRSKPTEIGTRWTRFGSTFRFQPLHSSFSFLGRATFSFDVDNYPGASQILDFTEFLGGIAYSTPSTSSPRLSLFAETAYYTEEELIRASAGFHLPHLLIGVHSESFPHTPTRIATFALFSFP